jgi:tRNA threonylcarbamoyladenosine modification (KEOPS) complex  Pcc1 subunit
MKNSLHNTLLILSAFVVSAASANVGGLDITVKKGGKAVFKGKTDTTGSFATGALEPGSYNVEVRSPASMDLKGQKLAITVTAGKSAPMQSTANGAHLRGGVAVSVDTNKTASLRGQVTHAGGMVEQKAPEGYEKVRANVKVINGKRHVWVPAPIGSNMGGRWVEEGTEGAVLSTSNKKGGDAEVMQKIQDQSSNVGQR